MDKYIKVDGHNSLVRDIQSGAIINTSEADYKKYVSQREESKKRNQELKTQRQEIDGIKEELKDIKILLQKLLEK